MRSEDWNRRYAETELVWSAGPNRFLAAEAADLPPGRALDLACGEGRNAIWLAERGWEVTAVDYAEAGVAKGRLRSPAIDFRVADLLEWEPDPAAYDLVIVFYLQLPADELALVLERAAAAVAPGGTFLLVGHDLRNLTEGHGGPKSATVLYTPADVVASLDGLAIERADTVERPVDEAVALDVLVRARRPARALRR
jgi:SAM-dependent methyltransferase